MLTTYCAYLGIKRPSPDAGIANLYRKALDKESARISQAAVFYAARADGRLSKR